MDALTNLGKECYAMLLQVVHRLDSIPGWALFPFAAVGFLSLATLLVPWALTLLTHRRQSLKDRYDARWALVTGGSSGIGLSLAHALAGQGLGVVVVAYGDALLPKAVAELKAAHPDVEIRSVAANLSGAPEVYLAAVDEATNDIDVQCVFLNAGYMKRCVFCGWGGGKAACCRRPVHFLPPPSRCAAPVPHPIPHPHPRSGFFAETPMAAQLDNLACNATASVALAHHFVRRLRTSKLRGCVAFTSSPANIIPSPFSVMYGATKSLLTHFASSLACEVGPDGIDVSVIHPSPVATRFYTGTHALPTLLLFKSTATGPDGVADSLLRGIGRSVIVDQGYYPLALRLLLRVVEPVFLTEVLAVIAGSVGDYKFMRQASDAEAKAAAASAVVAVKAKQPAAAATPGRKRASSKARK